MQLPPCQPSADDGCQLLLLSAKRVVCRFVGVRSEAALAAGGMWASVALGFVWIQWPPALSLPDISVSLTQKGTPQAESLARGVCVCACLSAFQLLQQHTFIALAQMGLATMLCNVYAACFWVLCMWFWMGVHTPGDCRLCCWWSTVP